MTNDFRKGRNMATGHWSFLGLKDDLMTDDTSRY